MNCSPTRCLFILKIANNFGKKDKMKSSPTWSLICSALMSCNETNICILVLGSYFPSLTFNWENKINFYVFTNVQTRFDTSFPFLTKQNFCFLDDQSISEKPITFWIFSDIPLKKTREYFEILWMLNVSLN